MPKTACGRSGTKATCNGAKTPACWCAARQRSFTNRVGCGQRPTPAASGAGRPPRWRHRCRPISAASTTCRRSPSTRRAARRSFFRHRLLRQREVPFTAAAHRASWETYVTALAGEEWTHPLPIPVTGGRSDHLTRIARGGQGRLFAVWATDHRNYDDYLFQKADVYFAAVPGLGGSANPAQLEPPRSLEALRIFTRHPNEAENLARIRNYRIESEGKTYRIFRGDTHRHTEWSADGNNDGSITDTYRYALNAAELDYLGLSEHHNNGGPNIEYINWLLGQRVDVYTVPGRFVPIYGYERGVGYPNGHRNIFFATRGNPTFPDRPGERETSSGRVGLFDYLKKYDGISIPHTSATNMGTDWRDDGGDSEPLVEIYQGGQGLGRIRRGAESRLGLRRNLARRRLPPRRLRLERLGERLQARRAGKLRPSLDAYFLRLRHRRRVHPRGLARCDAQTP